MQPAKDFERLLERLRESSPPESVLAGLSNLGGQGLALLTDVWPSFPTEHRQSIVTRLVEMAEADFEADFTQVFKMCLADEDPQVRATAIEGLWEIEDVALIRPLLRMLSDDESTIVREAAAISLSRFALLAELGRLQPELGERIWDALWKTIHNAHEHLDVRRRAVESLAYFGRPETTQVIRTAYQDDDSMMRISAVYAMGRSADEMWSEYVVAELECDDPAMRYEAARACGALQLYEAIPILGRMTADLDLEVKVMAVWALGQIGSPEAQRILEICSEMGDEALREAADEALEELDYMEGSLDFPLYDLELDAQDEEEEFWEDEEEENGFWEDEEEENGFWEDEEGEGEFWEDEEESP